MNSRPVPVDLFNGENISGNVVMLAAIRFPDSQLKVMERWAIMALFCLEPSGRECADYCTFEVIKQDGRPILTCRKGAPEGYERGACSMLGRVNCPPGVIFMLARRFSATGAIYATNWYREFAKSICQDFDDERFWRPTSFVTTGRERSRQRGFHYNARLSRLAYIGGAYVIGHLIYTLSSFVL